MPITRNSSHRDETKRTILRALNGNDSPLKEQLMQGSCTNNSAKTPDTANEDTNCFDVPKDLDVSDLKCVELFLEDIEKGVKARQESIRVKASQAVEDQRVAFFLGTMKLEKHIKKMTIRDFNTRFMDGGNILTTIKSLMTDNSDVAGKKRVRPIEKNIDLKTPARYIQTGVLPTVARAVKKGEILYSENGSPIDQSSAGAIIATVVKKRKGGGEASFEMDVGDGNHVNLSDPDAIDNLGSDMKSSARNQLKVLQDQMASLMTRLDEHNC